MLSYRLARAAYILTSSFLILFRYRQQGTIHVIHCNSITPIVYQGTFLESPANQKATTPFKKVFLL
jgi:hypothetical protein